MTITEAKKIIEMCADAVRKTDGDDAKIYVNKEYVLSILDMVEETPQKTLPEGLTWPDNPYPWNPTQPWITYTDNDRLVLRKVSDGTGDDAPGVWQLIKEPLPKPYDILCGGETSSKPNEPEVYVTAEDLSRYACHNTSMNPNNDTITTAQNTTVDASPKRTDFIEDFAPAGTLSR